MKTRAIPLGLGATRTIRDAALWLALLVALASSLLSGGMPRTTALGSAFNPATTSVVLKPIRPAPRVTAEVVRRDDGPAAGSDTTAAMGLAPARTEAVRPAHMRVAARASTPSLHPHAVLPGTPRGPPAA
ncbi:hypothetical protein ABS767_17110 [Sphingomonas sp. ST-64]|uniref:Secreted protein n=1 Tax=Sphingomonas plantiphila TaxID=3163295 RepID=A0ABW8YRC8_9SPHN